ncbi:protein of unknown function [endosymbiont DhMRE of Dentiscutata heterogama]|uniref:hypothetical protein n=1 Tax=endosymbiont DhMRE of Dentiscutata heterogama TaxID=1609546 RepID=UPI000629D24C|nr:hypothetical protein [endosymbiont DhMRE of Dentiscutata heterogama]CFW93394.1 protein of unknown function [endosymbiont DhMRE of Dentiscutata heterogama]
MVVKKGTKRKVADSNWDKLVNNLRKGIAEMEKDRKAGKKETLTAVEVTCTHEDVAKSVRGWKRGKK